MRVRLHYGNDKLLVSVPPGCTVEQFTEKVQTLFKIEELPTLWVDGFRLLTDEPAHEVLRENDIIIVRGNGDTDAAPSCVTQRTKYSSYQQSHTPSAISHNFGYEHGFVDHQLPVFATSDYRQSPYRFPEMPYIETKTSKPSRPESEFLGPSPLVKDPAVHDRESDGVHGTNNQLHQGFSVPPDSVAVQYQGEKREDFILPSPSVPIGDQWRLQGTPSTVSPSKELPKGTPSMVSSPRELPPTELSPEKENVTGQQALTQHPSTISNVANMNPYPASKRLKVSEEEQKKSYDGHRRVHQRKGRILPTDMRPTLRSPMKRAVPSKKSSSSEHEPDLPLRSSMKRTVPSKTSSSSEDEPTPKAVPAPKKIIQEKESLTPQSQEIQKESSDLKSKEKELSTLESKEKESPRGGSQENQPSVSEEWGTIDSCNQREMDMIARFESQYRKRKRKFLDKYSSESDSSSEEPIKKLPKIVEESEEDDKKTNDGKSVSSSSGKTTRKKVITGDNKKLSDGDSSSSEKVSPQKKLNIGKSVAADKTATGHDNSSSSSSSEDLPTTKTKPTNKQTQSSNDAAQSTTQTQNSDAMKKTQEITQQVGGEKQTASHNPVMQPVGKEFSSSSSSTVLPNKSLSQQLNKSSISWPPRDSNWKLLEKPISKQRPWPTEFIRYKIREFNAQGIPEVSSFKVAFIEKVMIRDENITLQLRNRLNDVDVIESKQILSVHVLANSPKPNKKKLEQMTKSFTELGPSDQGPPPKISLSNKGLNSTRDTTKTSISTATQNISKEDEVPKLISHSAQHSTNNDLVTAKQSNNPKIPETRDPVKKSAPDVHEEKVTKPTRPGICLFQIKTGIQEKSMSSESRLSNAPPIEKETSSAEVQNIDTNNTSRDAPEKKNECGTGPSAMTGISESSLGLNVVEKKDGHVSLEAHPLKHPAEDSDSGEEAVIPKSHVGGAPKQQSSDSDSGEECTVPAPGADTKKVTLAGAFSPDSESGEECTVPASGADTKKVTLAGAFSPDSESGEECTVPASGADTKKVIPSGAVSSDSESGEECTVPASGVDTKKVIPSGAVSSDSESGEECIVPASEHVGLGYSANSNSTASAKKTETVGKLFVDVASHTDNIKDTVLKKKVPESASDSESTDDPTPVAKPKARPQNLPQKKPILSSSSDSDSSSHSKRVKTEKATIQSKITRVKKQMPDKRVKTEKSTIKPKRGVVKKQISESDSDSESSDDTPAPRRNVPIVQVPAPQEVQKTQNDICVFSHPLLGDVEVPEGQNVQAAIDKRLNALKRHIKKQVEYYFSDENLKKDNFMKKNMDDEGYMNLSLIITFNMMQNICKDKQFVLQSLMDSETLEVCGKAIRRKIPYIIQTIR